MELTASELWSRILESARAGLPEQTYRTWLKATEATGLSDRGLVVQAPSQFHVEWLEDKYRPLLEDRAERILGRPLEFTFLADDDAGPPVPRVELTTPDQAAAPDSPSGNATPGNAHPHPDLNQRYTFGRFVVGNSNELAAAACHAVAGKPARTYNPLFLYGGVGLGKTHLMHAIGNQIQAGDPEHRVTYVPSEKFVNELVSAIRGGTTAAFRRRYRLVDLLLVDDIHFIEGKERTQEEFFHTFNALYDAQKQIVLTSDRPPKEIPGLEERLVSRFEWGLVADIKPPDYETRVAILLKKADDDGLTLAEDVIDYIAHSCSASVRELEGAVIKLLAYSSLKNQEINVPLARTALSTMMGENAGSSPRDRLTPERVREVVARRWGVKPESLSSRRRTRDVTVPRQIAMYLIKKILDTPLVRIGQAFGGRDHSTVIHSVRKVENEMEEDPEFRKDVEAAKAEMLGRQ